MDLERYIKAVLDTVDEKGIAPWGHFDSEEALMLWNVRHLMRESEIIQIIRNRVDDTPSSEYAIRGRKWCMFEGYWRDHFIKETLKAAEEMADGSRAQI